MHRSSNAISSFIEPLSESTGKVLRPLNLRPHDRLHLATDKSQHSADGWVARVTGHEGKEPSWDAMTGWHSRIPERKELGYGYFSFRATDFAALVIYHAWPKDQIVFGDDLAEDRFNYLVLRFLTMSAGAHMRADFKINGVVPEMPEDFIDHPDPALRLSDYQKVAVASSLFTDSCAFWMDRGTGKTATAIAKINLEGQRIRCGKSGRPRLMRVLVVAPRQVRLNWKNEFLRFSVNPGKVGVMRGNVFDRMRILMDTVRDDDPNNAFASLISSYDGVRTTWDALCRVKWDLIVLDEAHYIKNKGTRRTKDLFSLRDLCDRRLELTGSPIANSPMDLWSQMEFLDEGLSGFSRYEEFKGFHGKFEMTGEGIQRLKGLRNIPLLQERIARIAFVLSKEEAGLNLPPKAYDTFEVEMTKNQAEYYRKMRDALRLEITSMTEEGKVKNEAVTVENVLTKLLRLSQITSGFIRTDGQVDLETSTVGAGATKQIPGGNPKLQAVLDLLQDPDRSPKGKTIIWALYREDIRAISELLAQHEIPHRQYHGGMNDAAREEAVQAFNNDPAVRVFIANPKTAGEGLNLVGFDPANPTAVDTFTDHEIFFSQGWSLTERVQAEDRAHRRGTRTQVRITDLVVPGTIDEEIRARVTAKQDVARSLTDLTAIFTRILAGDVSGDEE